MDQPGLLLPSRDYYLKGRNDEIIKGIETIIKTFAYMIGGSAIEVERDVPDVVDFEIALAKVGERHFRDRPFNLQRGGGGICFFVSFRHFFFGQHKS